MKLTIKFFDQNFEITLDCQNVEVSKDNKNLIVKVFKSDERTIVRHYPRSNIEYYQVEE